MSNPKNPANAWPFPVRDNIAPLTAAPQSIAAQTVREIIAQCAQCEAAQVTDEKNLALDMGLDSLDRVELAMWIEDELGIKFSVKEEEAFEKTVGDVVRAVEIIVARRDS